MVSKLRIKQVMSAALRRLRPQLATHLDSLGVLDAILPMSFWTPWLMKLFINALTIHTALRTFYCSSVVYDSTALIPVVVAISWLGFARCTEDIAVYIYICDDQVFGIC